MVRILAIADDLTGAAEIAAAGLRHGLPSRLARSPLTRLHPGLTVVDTDTRNLPGVEAGAALARFIPREAADQVDHIFKKTDSVLRGPILSELHALMVGLDFQSSLLVPQNPSKARTIVRGVYHIAGVPLSKTSFRNDLTYPAWTADGLQLLQGTTPLKAIGREPGDDTPLPPAVVLGSGETAADLEYWGSRIDEHVLPAGGVDFFRASLARWGFPEAEEKTPTPVTGSRLFICGSLPGTETLLRKIPGRIQFLPATMADAPALIDGVREQLTRTGLCAVSVPQERAVAPDAPHRLEERMAHVLCTILAHQGVDTVFIEGGSTASAVFRWMGFHTFRVEGQLSPGVVVMTAGNESDGQRVVLKPGSYLWPDEVFQQ